MKCPGAGGGLVCLYAVAISGALVVACDPKETAPVNENGPPFLVLGRADTQPSTADGGTLVYVQARGGNLVTIEALSPGCRSDVGDFKGTTRACALMPYYSSQPFEFRVHTDVDAPCLVAATLYSVCDCPEAGSPSDYKDGPSAFAWCAAAGTPVTTTEAEIDPWLPPPTHLDAGASDGAAAPLTPADAGDASAPGTP